MDNVELDKQNSNVVILCEKYLQEDSGAMMLLNQIVNLIADFSLINERSDDDDEFDYIAGMEELVLSSKMMTHEMQKHNLLLMGNYGKHVANKQDKNAD
jgi:hypothetical protein